MNIGLLLGFEDGFRQALTERLQTAGGKEVEVTWLSTGGVRPEDEVGCDVILDRISRRVPYYRAFLAHAAMKGTQIVNDPAALRGGDGLLQLSVARELGIETPKAILLPQKDYAPEIGDAALGNLQYPLPWESHLEHVGWPAWIAPHDALGERLRVDSLEELWYRYDRSGQTPLLLREHVPAEVFVRALVVGGSRVLLTLYDPEFHEYRVDPAALDARLEAKLVDQAGRLAAALGLEITAVDFAVSGDRAVLLSGYEPTPDFELGTLGPFLFERVVESIADRLLELGEAGRRPAWTAEASREGQGLVTWLRLPRSPEPPAKPQRKTSKKSSKTAKRTSKSAKKSKASAKGAAKNASKPTRRKAASKTSGKAASKSSRKAASKTSRKVTPEKKASGRKRGSAEGGA